MSDDAIHPAEPAPTAEPAAPADRIEAMIRAVEKVQALPELSSTAKAVLIRLTLRYPGHAVRGECPSPAVLSPWLSLSERSIRRAYAELESAGYIGSPLGPDGKLALPLYDAAIADGWPEVQEDQMMDLNEHVAHLEWLRDLAVSRGRIGVAVNAEKAAGRALGFYGTLRGHKRRRPEAAISGREEEGAAPETTSPTETAWPEPAKAGSGRDEDGAAPAFSGSNWHELAETGTVFRTPADGGFYSKYKALMAGLPD